MIIAHLPAGYLLTKALQKGCRARRALQWKLTCLGLLASIFPDFDFLYYYLIDEQQTFHREYWTHLPVFWLIASLVLLALGRVVARQEFSIAALIVMANIYLHLILDTVTSPVYWFKPFSDQGVRLLYSKHQYDIWWLNYIFSSGFVFELIICLIAVVVFIMLRLRANAHYVELPVSFLYRLDRRCRFD